MADYFGYTKTTKGPGDLAGTSAVLVKINNSSISLCQNCRITYNRTVSPHYELGSDSVYMSAGHSSGTCEIGRMIGKQAALVPYQTGACDLSTISVAKGSAQCQKDIGTITMQGLLASVGVTADVGSYTISDSASYNIGFLTIN